MPTVDDYIAAAMSAFRARRGDRAIHAGGRTHPHPHTRRTHPVPAQRPTMSTCPSTTPAIATQIEDGDALHAIVRPRPDPPGAETLRLSMTVGARAHPDPIAPPHPEGGTDEQSR